MTKNDNDFVRTWLLYHGERFGYNNLHIIDDSSDKQILDLYEQLKHLNFNLHLDESGNRNLNNMQDYFRSIQDSEDDDAIFLKMDSDEFIVNYDENQNKIYCDADRVKQLKQTETEGFAVKYQIFSRNATNNPFDCTEFSPTHCPNYKSTFTKSERICLGGHNLNNARHFSKRLGIIHFHFKIFEKHLAKAKEVCASHGYIDADDSDTIIQQKLAPYRKNACSEHKVDFILSALEGHITPNSYNNDLSLDKDSTEIKFNDRVVRKILKHSHYIGDENEVVTFNGLQKFNHLIK